ncbi:hypothetical protein [Gloeocapsa sp. PCC 73106]|uniref:DUF6887 family protein n=1 Tax=Gloeocapsa sp. PCC 73106 TaxID=102232 RepID=UPI0002ACE874|nr:hypothetical protein [Gloeocapsa sp. PCC 73106]ELR98650.1 hypothetical protein GLO73106DRAFT_00024870 [Gloeocapsa sp. PCC 73106]
MTKDFAKMTKNELKAYLLTNRGDQEAFYAYIDKLQASTVIASHSSLDTESLKSIIEEIRKTEKE